MHFQANLDSWANVAAICSFFVTVLGAAVGIFGYLRFLCSWKRKERALVDYLREKKPKGEAEYRGQQTIEHLIRYVGLTEDEILKISFESKNIERWVSKDTEGKANRLFFSYID